MSLTTGLLKSATALLNRSKSFAFWPTSGNRSKKGTIRLAISERRLTSQYQPSFPALRIDPQAERLLEQIERSPIVLRDVEGGGESPLPTAAASSAAHDHEASLS